MCELGSMFCRFITHALRLLQFSQDQHPLSAPTSKLSGFYQHGCCLDHIYRRHPRAATRSGTVQSWSKAAPLSGRPCCQWN